MPIRSSNGAGAGGAARGKAARRAAIAVTSALVALGVALAAEEDPIIIGDESAEDSVSEGGDEVRIIIGRDGGEAGARPWGARYHGHDDRIGFGEDVVVAMDETVNGDVVAIGGDATIDGTVTGTVVAVGGDILVRGRVDRNAVAVWGSLELDPVAICGGDIVAIGGTADVGGAQVDGDVLSLNLFPGAHGVPALLSFRFVLLSIVVLLFVIFATFVLVAGLAIRQNTGRMLEEMRSRPFRSFAIGVVAHLLFPLALLLLAITVLGLPLAIVGVFVWWLVAQFGQAIAAVRLGQGLLGPARRESVVGPGLLVGLASHAVFAGVIVLSASQSSVHHVLATLLFFANVALGLFLMFTGTGAAVMSRLGESRARRPPATERTPDVAYPSTSLADRES